MDRRRSILFAAAALLTVMCICPSSGPQIPDTGGGDSPTEGIVPTSTPFVVSPTLPPQQAGIDGKVGGDIPVECNNVKGDVNFPPGSFDEIVEFKVQCLSEQEMKDLDQLVKDATGQTGEVLGAMRVEPSPYYFKTDVTLDIPLIIQRLDLAGRYVDLYLAAPDLPGGIQRISQAPVASDGWSARARVDHFSTFVLVEIIQPTVVPTDTPQQITCTDPLGCVVYPPGEPIHIAALLSPSGPSNTKTISKDILSGMETARSEHPSIAGHSIAIDVHDDVCDPKLAEEQAYKIIDDGQAAAVIGTTCPGTAQAAVPILSRSNYAILSPFNTDPTSAQLGFYYSGFYRIAPVETIEALALARYAREKEGMVYVTIIRDDRADSANLSNAFSTEFENSGGGILSVRQVPGNLLDFSTLIGSLKYSKRPDAYYLVLLPEQALAFVSQAQKAGLNETILGASSLNDDFYIRDLRVNGTLIAEIDLPVDKFTVEYARDATAFLLTALDKATIPYPDGSLVIRRSDLRAILSALKEDGKTGTIECGPLGDCAHPLIRILIAKDRELIKIDEVIP
ncbi:MAG: ABC transporter substrate-binding protein [Chloroflexota bacterium]